LIGGLDATHEYVVCLHGRGARTLCADDKRPVFSLISGAS
jgi:hypothetical protein